MVAYLLLVGLGLTLIVSGMAYNIISDLIDAFLTPLLTAFTDPNFAMDADTLETGNLLIAVFKFFLIPGLFIIFYWVWTYAQKPVRPY